MKYLFLFPTLKCNLNCSYCFTFSNNYDEIKFSQYKNFITKTKSFVNHYDIGGGEPLLYSCFFELISFIKKTNPTSKTTVTSNATLLEDLTNNEIKTIIDNVDNFEISIESLKESVNKYFRGENSLSAAISGINRLMKSSWMSTTSIDFSLAYTATKKNLNDFIDLIQWSDDNRFNSIYSQVFEPIGRASTKIDLFPDFKDYEKLILNTIRFVKKHPFKHLKRIDIYLPSIYSYKFNDLTKLTDEFQEDGLLKIDTISCYGKAFKDFLALDNMGHMTGCFALINHTGNYLLKDASLHSGESILNWSKKKHKELYSKNNTIRDLTCINCLHVMKCHTGCPAVKLKYNSSFKSKDPRCKEY